MPKVLVIGATGYIGSAVCDALVRSGNHIVYGLVRSPEKASKLALKEVLPVIGSISDSKAYLDLIRSVHIDVVVTAASFGDDTGKLVENVITIGKERLEKYKELSYIGPKLGFVATSGMWAHGSNFERTNDLSPVGNVLAKAQPPQMAATLPLYEQQILGASNVLDIMILRPAMVFGREGALWGALFGPILGATFQGSKQPVQIDAEPKSIVSVVHVDDVAEGFVKAVDKLPLFSGTGVHPVFDLVTERASLRLTLEAAAEVFGHEGGIEMRGAQGNIFMEAVSTSSNASNARAKQLLGWEPKKGNLLGMMDVYVNAFKAGQSK